MLLDKLMEFDPTGTAITVTAVSTNALDLHGASLIPAPSATVKPGRDMGIGSAMGALPKVTVIATEAFAAAGAGTLQVQVQGAPDNGAGAEGAYTTYAETPAIGKAALVAGVHIFDIDLPRVVPNPIAPAAMPRFLRLNYIVATGPMTAGKVYSGLTLGRDDQVQYIPGISVAN